MNISKVKVHLTCVCLEAYEIEAELRPTGRRNEVIIHTNASMIPRKHARHMREHKQFITLPDAQELSRERMTCLTCRGRGLITLGVESKKCHSCQGKGYVLQDGD